jgi:hypothetical protein
MVSTGNSYVDLCLLVATILGLGYGLLWLADRHERAVQREADSFRSAGRHRMPDSEGDTGWTASLRAQAGTAAVAADRYAALTRPYTLALPASPEDTLDNLSRTEVNQAVAALVASGGQTTAAALAHHIGQVERAVTWRRLVDDWQAGWDDFLRRLESGEYAVRP